MQNELDLRQRCSIWAATWVGAGVLTLPIWRFAFPAFALFPACLCFTFGFAPAQGAAFWVLALPYVFYGLLTLTALGTRRRSVFWVLEAVLCTFLVLNVVGCYLAIRKDSGEW